MPPKKAKGRKRASAEQEEKQSNVFDVNKDGTDLLSPSEVVKMRKKVRNTISESASEGSKESKSVQKARARGATESGRNLERGCKRTDKKELDKKKDAVTKGKKEKTERDVEGSKTKVNRRRSVGKKKTNPDESDNEQALVLYPCGICTKEVSDADDAILCEAGCEFWYHRNCTGMTDIAYQLLTNEDNAEWVCDKCIVTKSVPLVKVKSVEETQTA